MIRDRKMYVVPTPFALTKGTAGLATLILPEEYEVPTEFKCVGELSRIEGEKLVVGYSFDLRTNEISAETVANPAAGEIHKFKAYRCLEQSDKIVTMATDLDSLESSEDD